MPMSKEFIPREKMSKKARKELDSQGRVVWMHSPVTKVFESKKAYNRKKRDWLKEDNSGRVFSSTHDGSYFVADERFTILSEIRRS